MPSTPEMSPHKAEVCKTLSSVGQRVFKYVEFDDDEQMLAEIRKHPIGLVFIWLTGAFISAVVLVASVVLAYNINNLGLGSIDANNTFKTIILIIGIILSGLSVAMTAITASIYSSNVVFVTNEKVAEVLYLSLFNRRVKQLGIGNIEDVTVTQKGILPRLFNFGGLVVETAGEAEDPIFSYVPKPNEYSQIMIQAHEEYVQKYGN